MNEDLKSKVWERDKGICRNCGRALLKKVDHYDDLARELTAAKEIPVYKWSKECYNCGKETPIVSYDFAVNYNYHLGDIDRLDRAIMQRYSFVKRVFSKTRNQQVIANTCMHCGALQGNFYIIEDLIELAEDETDMEKLIDLILPNDLTLEDVNVRKGDPVTTVRLPDAQIHHRDGNWENNAMDNLILLCRNCHTKITAKHSNEGVRPPRTRAEVEEGRRVKREKQKMDRYREAYYASRKDKSI